MNCNCGKYFGTDIACSRHMSSCLVHREFLKNVKITAPVFVTGGVDHVVCRACGFKSQDISSHLRKAVPPHISIKEYKAIYPGHKLVCSDVEKKRKETCKKVYGNPNYKNSELQSSSIRKAFLDPELKNKIKETKMERYGDPYYVNKEKRKATLLARYGVDIPMNIPAVKEKFLNTVKTLYKDNPVVREPLIKKDDLERFMSEGLTLKAVGMRYGVSDAVASYWAKKHGIKVIKKIVVPKKKEFLTPQEIIRDYFDTCISHNKILSFFEYGKLTSDKKSQRMKHLFNSGGRYSEFLSEMSSVVLNPNLWAVFFDNLEASKDS